VRLTRTELALAFACIVMAVVAIVVNSIGLANYLAS
jgi:hypothetical protein